MALRSTEMIQRRPQLSRKIVTSGNEDANYRDEGKAERPQQRYLVANRKTRCCSGCCMSVLPAYRYRIAASTVGRSNLPTSIVPSPAFISCTPINRPLYAFLLLINSCVAQRSSLSSSSYSFNLRLVSRKQSQNIKNIYNSECL